MTQSSEVIKATRYARWVLSMLPPVNLTRALEKSNKVALHLSGQAQVQRQNNNNSSKTLV